MERGFNASTSTVTVVAAENPHNINDHVAITAEEVMNMMQVAGVAAGVVQNGEDLLEHDPQLRHRYFFWELDHPEIGRYRAPRQSLVLSKVPCELRRAPLLGEHTEYALKEILGMSDEEIAELSHPQSG